MAIFPGAEVFFGSYVVEIHLIYSGYKCLFHTSISKNAYFVLNAILE